MAPTRTIDEEMDAPRPTGIPGALPRSDRSDGPSASSDPDDDADVELEEDDDDLSADRSEGQSAS
jgi:hypothetical protein